MKSNHQRRVWKSSWKWLKERLSQTGKLKKNYKSWEVILIELSLMRSVLLGFLKEMIRKKYIYVFLRSLVFIFLSNNLDWWLSIQWFSKIDFQQITITRLRQSADKRDNLRNIVYERMAISSTTIPKSWCKKKLARWICNRRQLMAPTAAIYEIHQTNRSVGSLGEFIEVTLTHCKSHFWTELTSMLTDWHWPYHKFKTLENPDLNVTFVLKTIQRSDGCWLSVN